MKEEDFKRILDNALSPIRQDVKSLKEDTQGLKEDVKSLKEDLGEVKSDLNGVKADLNGVKADLKEVKETQAKHMDLIENRLLPSVTYTENTIKVYSDMYKMNNDNMKRLEKRMETVEEDAGVEVPEELTLKELPELPAH